jgi:hypothetical protein
LEPLSLTIVVKGFPPRRDRRRRQKAADLTRTLDPTSLVCGHDAIGDPFQRHPRLCRRDRVSDDLWVVRAGEKAKHVQEFIDGSYIAVGFEDLAPDDLRLIDEAALKARVTSPAGRTSAGQLTAFAYKMAVDDIVIVPRLTSRHRDYVVARISGPYQHSAVGTASGPHRRTVKWLGTFSRESLSSGAINTLGAILTLFRPTAVEAELRGLLTALVPLDGTGKVPEPLLKPIKPGSRGASELPVAVAPTPRDFHPAQLDIELDTQGRARIV